MNYNRLIFTKLDETDSYGILLNGVYLTGYRLSIFQQGKMSRMIYAWQIRIKLAL